MPTGGPARPGASQGPKQRAANALQGKAFALHNKGPEGGEALNTNDLQLGTPQAIIRAR